MGLKERECNLTLQNHGVQSLYRGSLPLYQPMSKGSPTPMLLLEICHAPSGWHNSQILEWEGVCERQEQRSTEGSLHIFNKLLGEKQSVHIYPISCAINFSPLPSRLESLKNYSIFFQMRKQGP